MQLERIEVTPLALIIGPLISKRRTGTLAIVRGDSRALVYFTQGDIVLVTPASPEQSLARFLVAKGITSTADAEAIGGGDSLDVVERFHDSGRLDRGARQGILRDWLAAIFIPLFAVDEASAVFVEEDALDPAKRILVPSTSGLFLQAIRSITNGLILRRSLGDLKRPIVTARGARFSTETLPLLDAERRIADSLSEPRSIDAFIKQFPTESGVAARVAIALLALGVFVEAEEGGSHPITSGEDMQHDMEVLAALGAGNPRALRAFAFSRRLPKMNHYEVLDVVRSASRAQISAQGELLRKAHDPKQFPPVIHDAVVAIRRRVDDAVATLTNPGRRPAYDALIEQHASITEEGLNQLVTQRALAEKNIERARRMSAEEDFYGAILLLKQSLGVVPENAAGWFLLGSCQERNPQWRRQAADSYQQALAADPSFVDAMISLGDIYKSEGLASRAQACYEDALEIDAENPQAKSRIASLVRKK